MNQGGAVRCRQRKLVLPPDGHFVVFLDATAILHEFDYIPRRRGYESARLDDGVVRSVTPSGAFRGPHEHVPPGGSIGPRSHDSLVHAPPPRRAIRSLSKDPIRGTGGTPSGGFVRRLPKSHDDEGAHDGTRPVAMDG